MLDILKNLNDQQQQAVLHQGGPAIILAGAGSGKTRVLTTRAAWLIKEQQLLPTNILLMTFTNKAAQEMNQRVQKLTGHLLPWSGTFHRICALILRKHGQAIGLNSNYVIYDSQDQESLIKQIYKDQGYDHKKYNRNGVRSIISQAKNRMLSPSKFAQHAENELERHSAQVYHLYQRLLDKNQAVDFDDLLLKTTQLFSRQPLILQKYQQQFLHILVDEYQDTNKVQYQLTKFLAKPQNNIYVVGDFSQSIYAWRGADYHNLAYFKKDFVDSHEYRLERNYRSTQNILDAATQIISQNTSHPILKLWTEQTQQELITVLESKNNETEAWAVINEIIKLKKYNYQDIAILYRVNAQSRPFEEVCVQQGIPYKLIGGFKFYERKEIKDLLAYLRLLLNPTDKVSRQRAIKLGKRKLAKFEAFAQKCPQLTPFAALEKIIHLTNYFSKYDENDPQDMARIENIQELLNVAAKFQNLAIFLENIALVQNDHLADLQTINQPQAITMMSLHAAKGLEFGVVFIVGMEEGLLPHARSFYNPDQLEEERRLCYVGITRAQKKLYLSYARSRWQYGQQSSSIQSRFLAEINPQLLQKKDSQQNHFKPKQRLILDDPLLDSVLNDEVDLDAFINS